MACRFKHRRADAVEIRGGRRSRGARLRLPLRSHATGNAGAQPYEGAKRLETVCHRRGSALMSPYKRRAGVAPDDIIEEVRLAADPARVYVQALRNVIGDPLAAPQCRQVHRRDLQQSRLRSRAPHAILGGHVCVDAADLQFGLVRSERGDTSFVRGHLGKTGFHRQDSLRPAN